MDEHNGFFRIASTTSSPKTNNVYIFAEDMTSRVSVKISA